MKIIIKSAKIVDPNSSHHNKVKDILIVDNEIVSIKNNISADNAKVIEVENLHVSPGWIDMKANFCEPGEEYKEDLISGSMAAAAGGFTQVVVMPTTHPVTDNKAAVEFIKNKTRDLPVEFFPMGALTKGCEGKEIAEMYDMH